MNYTTFFHQTDSERMVEQYSSFQKPEGFDDRLGEVEKRIAELNNRRQQRVTPAFDPTLD